MEFYLGAVGEKGGNGNFNFFLNMLRWIGIHLAVPTFYLHTRAVGYEPYASSEWMIPYGKEVKTLRNNI